MSMDATLPAVIRLFESKGNRKLLQWAYDSYGTEQWYGKQDLEDEVSLKREAMFDALGRAGQDIGILVRVGIIEVTNPDARLVRYRPRLDSSVFDALDDSPLSVSELCSLFDVKGTRVMTAWFLTVADPEDTYTKTDIKTHSEASHMTVYNNIDRLVDANIVDEVDGVRGPEYQVANSEMVDYLYSLNDLLYAYYERIDPETGDLRAEPA